MPVFHLNSLPKENRIQMIGEFYDVIDSLENRQEVRLFFKDLLGADEIATLMRRIEIAVLLSAHFSYDEIIQMLGVGTAKISKVHKCLQQDENGYSIIVKRLIENRKARLKKIKKEEKQAVDPMGAAKRSYKGYFLLNNLLDEAIAKLNENDKDLEKEALLFTPSASLFRNGKK